jgi:hypothetical protein
MMSRPQAIPIHVGVMVTFCAIAVGTVLSKKGARTFFQYWFPGGQAAESFDLPAEILALPGEMLTLRQLVAGLITNQGTHMAVTNQVGTAVETVGAAVQTLNDNLTNSWNNGIGLHRDGIAAVDQVIQQGTRQSIRQEIFRNRVRMMRFEEDVRERMEQGHADEELIQAISLMINNL